jgi:FkbM family methyltransferase
MKLFGRKPARYLFGLIRLPQFLQACWRALLVYQQPVRVIFSYVTRRVPRDRVVRLRDGHVIHLSNDSADILTVFLVFAREDYGRITPGSVVVDIGANIGVFALFAACSGARIVEAYEPSAESFSLLQQNIAANGFDNVIHAKRYAVVGEMSGPVKFPRSSSVHNAILSNNVADAVDFDLVSTRTLSQVVAAAGSVDLLKLDCEGAEYDIFLKASCADVRRAAEIRPEYHVGPRDALIEKLRSHGFLQRRLIGGTGGGGCLWLVRGSGT